MIRRPPRSTLSSSSAASDVYKRQLAEFPIKVPVIIQKSFQLFLVIRHYWPQFLVVSPIMNPTKSMMICNLLELRCIITQKCGNHRYVCTCLLYTSDAADEEDSVDLGGRRIIKKKKKKQHMTH